MRIVSEPTLKLFRGPGPCEWCGRFQPRLEAAHIFPRGSGRLDIPLNLCGLGPVLVGCGCHNAHHNRKRPTQADLLRVVSAREGVRVDQIIDCIYALRRADKSADAGAIIREVTGCADRTDGSGIGPGAVHPTGRRQAGAKGVLPDAPLAGGAFWSGLATDQDLRDLLRRDAR